MTKKGFEYDQFVHGVLEDDEYSADISYFNYLLRKEKATGLDDEERWELQDFISKHGYQTLIED